MATSSMARLTLVTGMLDNEDWQAMLVPQEQSLRYGECHPIFALRLTTQATLPLRLVTVLCTTPLTENVESAWEACLNCARTTANDWEWERDDS